MSAPDAETYLRCRLEDLLADGLDEDSSDLVCRVRAALAVGLIDEPIAEAVLADAARVAAFRRDWDIGEDDDETASTPPRVVVCPTVISQPWGTLMVAHVTFGEDETSIGVRGSLDPDADPARSPSAPRRHGPHHHPFGPDAEWREVEIVDAAGTTHQVHFSGSSSGGSFDGEYCVVPPLDAAAPVITVAGQRIELADRAEPPAARIVALPELSVSERADRYLAMVGDGAGMRPWIEEGPKEIAIETLADLGVTGLITTELARSSSAVPAGRTGRMRASFSRGNRHHSDPAASRWHAIGTIAGPVDGLIVTFGTLSDDGQLTATFSAAGRIAGPLHEGWPGITATDDLGNTYTCSDRGGSGNDREYRCSLVLSPPPATEAGVLTLAVDTLRHRIEVDVPLDWQEAR